MIRAGRRWLALAACAAAAILPAGVAAAAAPAPVRHVFVIVLENESAATTFGPSAPAPYLARTLTAQGAYLPRYHAIGHASLDNYVAMISGQAPNVLTQADCALFADFLLPIAPLAGGQQPGVGCVYPASVPTLAGQLAAAGLTWRAYAESMGADPAREAAVCGHPPLDGLDPTQTATARDQFAARHVPFLYFHSIIDDTTLCDTHVVGLEPLAADLRSLATTPNYAFITPDLCDDGHDATCANRSRPGGYAAIDAFLSTWVPRITASPAFRRDGLLIVAFDESESRDSAACCGEIPGPGSPLPGLTGPGGGVTGAVALSPFIKPGTVSQVPYNHYSMLRSVEDLFGLAHLGEAALPGASSFGDDVFTGAPAAPCTSIALPRHVPRRLAPNTLVQAVRVAHARGGRSRITLRATHAARLRVRARPRRQRARTIVARHIHACRRYSIALPRGHGVATITATAGGGRETTTRRY